MAMRILGHRGASSDHPENTLEAFIAAVEQGADGVELDVMRCGTGELVVCHDEWLDRLAGLHVEVATSSYARLKRVDVGTRLGFAPARMPRLEEVFEALPEHFVVNVELKCDTLEDRGLSVAVGAALGSVPNAVERVIVSSFNPACLVRFAARYAEYQRGFLIDPDKGWHRQAWWWAPVTASTSIHPYALDCTPERVSGWHQRGWQVAAWTVDDIDEARSLRAMGVDYLITNRPGAMRVALENYRVQPSAPRP